MADYRVEFFDPVETAPAAYIDCELTVGGRTLPQGITPAPGIYIRRGASGPSKILLR